MTSPEPGPGSALGQFIREQRQLAKLSLREMARLTSVSNAYLSQVERGLHAPSVRVLQSLAEALGVPVEELLHQGTPGARTAEPDDGVSVEAAVRRDRRLSPAQKEALLSVYRGFLEAADGSSPDPGS